MAQTMNQLKRNLWGYRLINHYGIEVVSDFVLNELTGFGLTEETMGELPLECSRKLIFNKKKLNEEKVEIITVKENKLGEDLILEIMYKKEDDLMTAEYIVEEVITEGLGYLYRVRLIEEE